MCHLITFLLCVCVSADVTMNDRGLYSCNLHHHYCHLYETVRVQLNITKSRMCHAVPQNIGFSSIHKATLKHFVSFMIKAVKSSASGTDRRRCSWCCLAVLWCCRASTDVMCGRTGATRRRTSRCVQSVHELVYLNNNGIMLYRLNLLHLGGFQVVHWDRQSPGIRHDRADRLVDLYASGEQRSYGPLFLQRKMNISNQAFSQGDFSLTISDLQVCEVNVAGITAGACRASVRVVKIYCHGKRVDFLTRNVCALDSVFTCLRGFQNTWKFH